MAKMFDMYTVDQVYEMLARRVFQSSTPPNHMDMFSMYCVKYIDSRYHSLDVKELELLSKGVVSLYRHVMLGAGTENPTVNQGRGALGSLLKDLENAICVELILRQCNKDEKKALPSGKMNDNIKDNDDKK